MATVHGVAKSGTRLNTYTQTQLHSQVPVSVYLQTSLSLDEEISGLTDVEIFSFSFVFRVTATDLPACSLDPAEFITHRAASPLSKTNAIVLFLASNPLWLPLCPPQRVQILLRDMQGPRLHPVDLPGRTSHCCSHSTLGQSASYGTSGCWLMLSVLQYLSPLPFTWYSCASFDPPQPLAWVSGLSHTPRENPT